ncbi:hypothetical protein [Caulobacter segnis]
MRAPMLVLAGTALLALSACATPRAVGQGDVSAVKGAAVAAYASQADGDDAAFARAVQGQAISRLGGQTGSGQPAYLVQVGVAVAPPAMGVSSAAGALDTTAWRSQAEKRRWWQFWGHKGPARTVTLAVVDAKTGKTTAWSSIRVRKGEPADVADLLVYALQTPTLKTPAKS